MKTDFKKTNTGELLITYFKNNAMQSTRLAELLGITPQTITKYKERTSLRTDRIEAISYALKHNFFQDLANHLPREFTVNADLNSANQELIAQLQEENKVLRIQNELLMKLKG